MLLQNPPRISLDARTGVLSAELPPQRKRRAAVLAAGALVLWAFGFAAVAQFIPHGGISHLTATGVAFLAAWLAAWIFCGLVLLLVSYAAFFIHESLMVDGIRLVLRTAIGRFVRTREFSLCDVRELRFVADAHPARGGAWRESRIEFCYGPLRYSFARRIPLNDALAIIRLIERQLPSRLSSARACLSAPPVLTSWQRPRTPLRFWRRS